MYTEIIGDEQGIHRVLMREAGGGALTLATGLSGESAQNLAHSVNIAVADWRQHALATIPPSTSAGVVLGQIDAVVALQYSASSDCICCPGRHVFARDAWVTRTDWPTSLAGTPFGSSGRGTLAENLSCVLDSLGDTADGTAITITITRRAGATSQPSDAEPEIARIATPDAPAADQLRTWLMGVARRQASPTSPASGHRFHIVVASQGSYGSPDGTHTDSDWISDPWTVTVRAWDLRAALRSAAGLPLGAWYFDRDVARLTDGPAAGTATYVGHSYWPVDRQSPGPQDDDPRFEVVARLPHATQILIFGPYSSLDQGRRSEALAEVAHRAAEAGLSNDEILGLLDALCDRWGKYPTSRYARWSRLLGLIRSAGRRIDQPAAGSDTGTASGTAT